MDLDAVDNEAYLQGRELGRTVSDAQASLEIAGGAMVAGAGAAGIAPTVTIGIGCTALSGGLCVAVAVPAVAVEAGMVVAGGATAAHGAVMMARNVQQGSPSSSKFPTSELPTNGQRRYVPPKQNGNPPFVKKGKGYVDIDGNLWEWTKDPHGGPHWDVQHPNGQHTNVGPDGSIIGADRFPNRPR